MRSGRALSQSNVMRRLTQAGFAALAVAAAVGFAAILIASVPPVGMRVLTAPMAVSDRLPPEEADYVETEVDQNLGAGAAFVFLRLPDGPVDRAVLINQAGTNAALWCGGLFELDGRLRQGHTRRYMSPLFLRIPAGCEAGAYLVVANQPDSDAKSLAHLYVGDADQLYDVFVWRRLLKHDMARISTGVGALILGLTLVIYRRLDFGATLPWFTGLMAVSMAYNIHIVLLIDSLGDWARWTLGYPLSLIFMAAATAFVGAWTGDRPGRLRLIALIGVIAAVLALFWLLARGGGGVAGVVAMLQSLQMAATAYAVWRLVRFAGRADPARYWEIALFLAAIAIFTVDLWFNSWGLRTYLPTSFPIFIFVIIAAAGAARMAEAFEAMSQLNTVLDRKLNEKEAALDAEYARRREEERMLAQAEERQRIMIDMHDGIGARLLGLAADAQNGPARDLIPDIHGAVEELRLIVNALDAVGDDLIAALAGFRRSIEPKLNAAGFSLDWRIDRLVRLEGLGTDDILNLYRLMQEACANAMRHSGGNVIRIALTNPAAPVLAIGDNGQGMGAGAGGKGMAGMAARAARLGAAFDVRSSDMGGVEVGLSFSTQA